MVATSYIDHWVSLHCNTGCTLCTRHGGLCGWLCGAGLTLLLLLLQVPTLRMRCAFTQQQQSLWMCPVGLNATRDRQQQAVTAATAVYRAEHAAASITMM
jgi:hypothetical protein